MWRLAAVSVMMAKRYRLASAPRNGKGGQARSERAFSVGGMGWRRVWRDVKMRRPVFDLVADPRAPIIYRGRPFHLERLPVDETTRQRIRAWASTGDHKAGAALASELAARLRAAVAWNDEIYDGSR